MRGVIHEQILGSNKKVQLMMHKSKETTIEGISDSFLNSVGIRGCIKALKGELNELIRSIDSGICYDPAFINSNRHQIFFKET